VGNIYGKGKRVVVAFFLSETNIADSSKIVVNLDKSAEMLLRNMEKSVKIQLPSEVRKKNIGVRVWKRGGGAEEV